MSSRLLKSLRKLGAKCTTEGTQVKGDNIDGIIECIAEHFGGGVTSWNDLTDKPFGEIVEYGDTLTLDKSFFEGNIVTDSSGYYVKVSDATPTIDDFVNGCVLSVPNMGSLEIQYNEILEMYNNVGVVTYEVFIVIPSDNFTIGEDEQTYTFPEKGFYFLYNPNNKIDNASFTIPGYKGFATTTVKQIEEKYLPIFDTVSGGEVSLGDTVSWDGNIETFEGVKTNRVTNESVGLSVQAVKVSDSIPSASDIGSNSTLKYVSGGNEVSNSITHISENDDGSLAIGDDSMLPIQIIPTDNFTNSDGITYPEAGTYFTLTEVNGQKLYATEFTIPNYTFTIKQPDKKVIKPELLPESGGRTLKTIEYSSLEEFYNGLVSLENAIFYDLILDNRLGLTIEEESGSTSTSYVDSLYLPITITKDLDNTIVVLKYFDFEGVVTMVMANDGGAFMAMFQRVKFDGTSEHGTITTDNVTKFTLTYF